MNFKLYFVCTLLIAVIFIAMYFKYVVTLSPDAVYMDTLRFLTYFEDSELNKSSLYTTWNQGDHHFLLPQFVVYLSAKFFNLNIIGSILSSGIVILLTSMFLVNEQYWTINSYGHKYKYIILTILSFVTFIALFSLANWELYCLDVGVALFVKNLIFVIYWIYLNKALASDEDLFLKSILLLSTPIIILLIAGGWSYAFIMATIICIVATYSDLFGKKRFVTLLVITLIISQLLYIEIGHYMYSGRGDFSVSNKISSYWNIIVGLFTGLSSIFIGTETMSALKMPILMKIIIPIPAITATSLVLMKSRNLPFVPLALISYSILHLLAVAYARGRFDSDLTMAPRYYMDLSLFIIGSIWVYCIYFVSIGYNKISLVIKFFILTALMMFLTGQWVTFKNEWQKAPYRAAAFNQLKRITLTGVNSEEDSAMLQSSFFTAKKGVDIQRNFELGPFRNIKCTEPFHLSGWFDEENIGWIGKESTSIIKNCGPFLHMEIFIPEKFTPKTIYIEINNTYKFSKNVIPNQNISVDLPIMTEEKFLNITVNVDKITIPAEIYSNSTDRRELGVIISLINTRK